MSVTPGAGLCARCRHRKVVGNRRGSLFTLCLRSRTEPGFPRYPPLPVLRCAGFQEGRGDPWGAFANDEEEGGGP